MGLSLALGYVFYARNNPPLLTATAAAALVAVLSLLLAWDTRPLVLSIHERAVTLQRWPARPLLTVRDEEVVQVGISFTRHYAQEEIYVNTVTHLTLVAANGARLEFNSNRRQADEVLRAVHDRLLPRLTAWMHGRLDAGHKIHWGGQATLEREGLLTLRESQAVPYSELTLHLEEEVVHVGTTMGRGLFTAKLSELNTHACLQLIEERMDLDLPPEE